MAPALVQLLARMLSRDVHVRPQSATEVAEALQGYASGSDLPALARGACEKMDAEPPNPRDPGDLLLAPGAAWLDRGDGDASGSVPAARAATGFRIGRGLALAALALVFLTGGGWLGITILLNTGEGQLRIESQAADVRVRLLRNGEEAETLEVEQGSQTVKLRAGKYEIEIDGPADELVLSEDSVRIIRNEETVVTVIRVPLLAAGRTGARADAAGGAAPGPPPTEISADALRMRLAAIPGPPVYNGKGPHEWLNVLKTDLQRERQEEALRALMAIAGELPADYRAELLLVIGQDMLSPVVQGDPRQVSLVVAAERRL